MRAASALICLGGLVAAPSALAEVQNFPALYAVSGVERSDRLNLREKPDAKSPMIGGLAPDAEDVEVTELSRDGSWGRVNLDDRSAWVAMRFLTRQEGPPWWDPAVPLSCYGTEPFWGMRLAEGQAVFDSPDGPEAPQQIGSRAGPRGGIGGPGTLLGMTIDGGFAIISARFCSDGMSDRANGLSIDLFRMSSEGLVGYSGCCSLLR